MNHPTRHKTIAPLLLITLALLCFSLAKERKRLFRRRMAVTRGSPRQKGIALFKTSPLALATQLLVGIRFLRTLPGT